MTSLKQIHSERMNIVIKKQKTSAPNDCPTSTQSF